MISRRFLLLWLPLLTLSCTPSPTAPPLPATVQTIAVLPPNNRTGDPLLIESASFLHPYADRPGRVTVPDALATEVRGQLARSNAAGVALLYGGSVKADNAKSLFAMADIDGGLIGGASLRSAEFLAIARA